MSKNKKYRNIDPEDLIRYSTNGLSDEERHALERETQRDSFMEEALEGYSSIHSDQAVQDLSRLQSRLKRRISGRRSMVWVGMAASVAVILTLGTLYFTVFNDKLGNLDKTVAESESVEPAGGKGIPEDLKIRDEVEMDDPDATEQSPEPEIQYRAVEPEVATIPEILDGGGDQPETDDNIEVEEPVIADDADSDEETEFIVADEVIIAEEDSQPSDNFLMLEMEAVEDMAQSRQLEGAVADEGVSMDAPQAAAKKESRSKSAVSSVEMLPDSIPALPVGGMESFNRYIEENIRYPDGGIQQASAVVVLTFSITNEGRPEQVQVEESPGEDFSIEAIRLLREGPAWSPAFIDSRPVVKRNRLKIEFTGD
jgi:hypothetical protein